MLAGDHVLQTSQADQVKMEDEHVTFNQLFIISFSDDRQKSIDAGMILQPLFATTVRLDAR